jgi:hypothetical protein
MRFFFFSILVTSLMACKSDYGVMKPVSNKDSCIKVLKPRGLGTSLYNTSVDVVGKHISGLLLIKEMNDGGRRIVFTNEAGVTFFDFEFTASGVFSVKHIVKQLNKKAVVKTLETDFKLLLGYYFGDTITVFEKDNELFFGSAEKKRVAYFITDPDCASLQRLELRSKDKRMVSVSMQGNDPKLPESVSIQHHTFSMTIGLKKIQRQ